MSTQSATKSAATTHADVVTASISEDQARDIDRIFEFLQSTGISGAAARTAARKMVLQLNVGTVKRLENRYRKGTLATSLEESGLTKEDIEDIEESFQQNGEVH